jgi:anti-sigma factor RsiW
VSCEPERITGYVDGELGSVERAAVEMHLQGCAACREQVAAERALRAALRALPERHPPAGMEGRLRAKLRAARPNPWRVLLPVAAALVGVALWAARSPAVVAWELSRDHDKCFGMPRLPAKVFTGDAASAVARLEPASAAMLALPDTAGGLELIGGRLCPLADRRVIHLYYSGGRQRRVSLFVVPGSLRLDRSYAGVPRGKVVRLLRIAGTTVGVVGEHPDDVAAFERALVQTRAALQGAPLV